MVHSETISLSTKGFSDIIDLTDHVMAVLKRSKIENGLVTVFCPGSTGGITTIEYESGVLKDLQKAIEKIVPSDIPYEHDKRWGDGNGFSHVRAALMKPSLTIPSSKEDSPWEHGNRSSSSILTTEGEREIYSSM